MTRGFKKGENNPDFLQNLGAFLFQWARAVYFTSGCSWNALPPARLFIDTPALLRSGRSPRWRLSPWSTACSRCACRVVKQRPNSVPWHFIIKCILSRYIFLHNYTPRKTTSRSCVCVWTSVPMQVTPHLVACRRGVCTPGEFRRGSRHSAASVFDSYL